MARKNVLSPQCITASGGQSLAASFNSTATIIQQTDNIAYQINVTTSNSTGSFSVQGSVDYIPRTFEAPGNTGNWVTLSLGGDLLTVAAANDNMLINLSQVPFNALRIAYTSTVAGTGTCEIYVMTKQIGG